MNRLSKRLKHWVAMRLVDLGLDFHSRSESRRILERKILPQLAADANLRRVLFVGCAWYTYAYNRVFKHKDYATLEIDPSQARFGAPRHIIDSAVNLAHHFAPSSLDLIVCNGVFGWGLNDRADVERTFAACHNALRAGGLFVLGWDDVPEHRPFPLAECQALQAFTPHLFADLGSHYLCNAAQRHVYDFFAKPADVEAPLKEQTTPVPAATSGR